MKIFKFPSFSTHFRIPLALQGGLLLAIIVSVLHVLDRQGEFVSRTDFLWKAKLKVEQEEVETMRGINKILLENILPAHVGKFLTNLLKLKINELFKFFISSQFFSQKGSRNVRFVSWILFKCGCAVCFYSKL